MKKVVLLLLPLAASAKRPGAFNDELIYIYVSFIALVLSIAYAGKGMRRLKQLFRESRHK